MGGRSNLCQRSIQDAITDFESEKSALIPLRMLNRGKLKTKCEVWIVVPGQIEFDKKVYTVFIDDQDEIYPPWFFSMKKPVSLESYNMWSQQVLAGHISRG